MRILFSGCWTEKYAGDHTRRILSNLVPSNGQHHTIVLHNAPGWAEDYIQSAGYLIEKIGWVSDYEALLEHVDVQIFPIAIGTGTKGKVLSALRQEVYCIGSVYAFANISPSPSRVHAIYNMPEEVPTVIDELVQIDKEALKAYSMRLQSNHAPEKIIGKLWQQIS